MNESMKKAENCAVGANSTMNTVSVNSTMNTLNASVLTADTPTTHLIGKKFAGSWWSRPDKRQKPPPEQIQTDPQDTSAPKSLKPHFKKHKHWSKYKPPQKYSLGIACVKIEKTPTGTKYKILMINKRHTYAFSDFVNGKYPADFIKNPQSKQHIMKMLNSMTVAEKLDIISMNFDILWYRLWSNGFHKSHSYIHAKSAFETAFGSPDKAAKLKKMVSKSTHSQIVWEVPKGRKKNKSESEVNCAMREFWEETGVAKSDYKVIPGVRKSYSFIDEGIQYNYTYFVAVCKNDVNPVINFDSPEQINEVSDIKWLDIEGVKFVDTDGKLAPFVRSVFKTVAAHIKV